MNKHSDREGIKEELRIIAGNMKRKVAGVIAGWLEGVTFTDFEAAAETHLSPEHVEEKITAIQRYLPGYLTPEKKILEVGCGFGAFTVFCRAMYGYLTCGIEPDTLARNLAHELAELAGVDCPIENSTGENLPFANQSFDFVYSSNVLEHVQDPARVLAESVRVLKPGGYLFFTYPNYCSFWEGHYGVPWIPCLSKPLAKAYVRLFGRNPRYIDSLHFLNVGVTNRMVKPFLDQVEVVTFGADLWQERMRTLKFGAWGQTSKLKKALTLIHKLPFLLEFGILFGKTMSWYYPIVLVLRKKNT
jgi:SAM-dependent methyltransferase